MDYNIYILNNYKRISNIKAPSSIQQLLGIDLENQCIHLYSYISEQMYEIHKSSFMFENIRPCIELDLLNKPWHDITYAYLFNDKIYISNIRI